jgi:hypothetical protein
LSLLHPPGQLALDGDLGSFGRLPGADPFGVLVVVAGGVGVQGDQLKKKRSPSSGADRKGDPTQAAHVRDHVVPEGNRHLNHQARDDSVSCSESLADGVEAAGGFGESGPRFVSATDKSRFSPLTSRHAVKSPSGSLGDQRPKATARGSTLPATIDSGSSGSCRRSQTSSATACGNPLIELKERRTGLDP